MFLLFHNGGVLFSLGFTILMCVILVLLFNALPSRKNKMGNRKFRAVGGVNRVQRRKEQAVSRRKRS
jgi:hypothetical protein